MPPSIHNIAFLVGRLIVGSFFLMNGFNHFAPLNMMAGYAKSKGVPLPRSPLAVRAYPCFACWSAQSVAHNAISDPRTFGRFLTVVVPASS